jgi:hypothetical protein
MPPLVYALFGLRRNRRPIPHLNGTFESAAGQVDFMGGRSRDLARLNPEGDMAGWTVICCVFVKFIVLTLSVL